MKLKTIVVTVVVLAVLSLGAWFLQRPPAATPQDARVGQPLAASDVVANAAQFRLSDKGKTVTLVRNADGTWKDASFHDLPVDFVRFTRFVDDLGQAKIQRLVTAKPERIARLEFNDTQIAFLDAAGKELWKITFGKNAEAGGGRFVRYGAEDKAYLTNFSGWIDPDAKNWANPQLLTVKPESVARAVLAFENGDKLTLSRAKKEDPWTADNVPAGQQLKADSVAPALNALTGIRFTEVAEKTDPAFVAAQSHLRPYELTTFDGKTYRIALGRKPEEKKPKASAAPAPAAASDTKPVPAAKDEMLAASATAPGATVAATAAAPATPSATGSAEESASAATIAAAEAEKNKDGKEGAAPAAPKPAEPEYETIPAGPIFVTVSGEAAANPAVEKLAFQVADIGLTNLPEKSADFFAPLPPPPPPAPIAAPASPAPPAPAPQPAPKPAETKKP